jgi:hypothetical protein
MWVLVKSTANVCASRERACKSAVKLAYVQICKRVPKTQSEDALMAGYFSTGDWHMRPRMSSSDTRIFQFGKCVFNFVKSLM